VDGQINKMLSIPMMDHFSHKKGIGADTPQHRGALKTLVSEIKQSQMTIYCDFICLKCPG
jgi:hypothetical protein